jgi:hypothetical protein
MVSHIRAGFLKQTTLSTQQKQQDEKPKEEKGQTRRKWNHSHETSLQVVPVCFRGVLEPNITLVL